MSLKKQRIGFLENHAGEICYLQCTKEGVSIRTRLPGKAQKHIFYLFYLICPSPTNQHDP